MHYQRMRRTGSYDGLRPATAEASFWLRVDKLGPVPDRHPELGPCWIWTGGTFWNGYGQFRHPKTPQGTSGLAHRAAWIFAHGEIGEGLHIDHRCETSLCVRASDDPEIPDHLEPVTRRTNILRGNGFAGVNARKTHCVNDHEYTPENTVWENGWRKCRTCRKEKARERYARAKAHRTE